MNQTAIAIRRSVKEIQELSTSIPKLSEALERMKEETGLTERAIIVLVADAAGVGKASATRVLHSFEKMKKLYIKEYANEPEPASSAQHPG